MQKQALQMQKQGKLPANYNEACEKCDGDHDTKDHDKSKEQSDGTFNALKDMKPDAKDIDPREVPTRINLAKNKLRAMGLKMSYDMEGEEVNEEMSIARRQRAAEIGAKSPSYKTRFAAMKLASGEEKPVRGKGNKAAKRAAAVKEATYPDDFIDPKTGKKKPVARKNTASANAHGVKRNPGGQRIIDDE